MNSDKLPTKSNAAIPQGRSTFSMQNAEREQGIIRVIVGVIACFYLYTLHDLPRISGVPVSAHSMIIPVTIYTTLLLALIHAFPGYHPIRIVFGIAGDLSLVMLVMALTGVKGLPLGVVNLWVIMGNGFRFGPRYLGIATGISAVEFIGVYRLNTWWQQHTVLFDTQLIGIIVLPLYMAVLLTKLEKLIEAANTANQSKSRFLANMSHELRTPLNGIIGMGDILLSKNPTEKQRGLIETMQVSANKRNRCRQSKIRKSIAKTVSDDHPKVDDTHGKSLLAAGRHDKRRGGQIEKDAQRFPDRRGTGTMEYRNNDQNGKGEEEKNGIAMDRQEKLSRPIPA